MKVGIKKLHENEWLVHIGCGAVKLDQFSVALLNITLEHLLALDEGAEHSTLSSYVNLGLRIKGLKPVHMQKFLREIDTKDLLVMMLLAKDEVLNQLVLNNIGGILSKQLQRDLATVQVPEEEESKNCLRRLIEKSFELESLGQIEFTTEDTRYI